MNELLEELWNHPKKLILSVIGTLLTLKLLFGSTVYDCSKVEATALNEGLKQCTALSLEEQRLEQEKYKFDEEQELLKLKEENRHKEEMAKIPQSKKALLADTLSSASLKRLSSGHHCPSEVKKLMCSPRMFLWKLWFL